MRLLTIAAAITLMSCSQSGTSSAEVQDAAKERVRETLKLRPGATLFSNVFVGEPVEGDIALCGTVSGTRADGTEIRPRRFIAALDPERWVKFEPATGIDLPSQPDKFVEWHSTCAGEEEVV